MGNPEELINGDMHLEYQCFGRVCGSNKKEVTPIWSARKKVHIPLRKGETYMDRCGNYFFVEGVAHKERVCVSSLLIVIDTTFSLRSALFDYSIGSMKDAGWQITEHTKHIEEGATP